MSAAAVVEVAQAAHPRRAMQDAEPAVRLTMLGGFGLRLGASPVMLAAGPQRIVAFVALHPRPLRRAYIFGSLWPDTPEHRAAASLRSAIWRIQTRVRLLAATGDLLRLDEQVQVDFHEASGNPMNIDRSVLALDLLPGWYDDWVLIERERWRQVRLRALEARCEALALAGRFGEALEVGLEALATDPLRESAHRALVRVHLAEGNVGEARRQYRLCEMLLRQELGVAPSAQMHELGARSRRLTVRASAFRFALASLATWRLTHLLAEEDGPADAVVRLRQRVGDGALGAAMDCFHCASVWIGAVHAPAVTRRRRDLPLVALALSGAACLLERATTKGAGNELLREEAQAGVQGGEADAREPGRDAGASDG